MSVWTWIGDAAESGVDAVGALYDWVSSALGGIGDRETRRQVAFSMALIALSAKMAKADGVVTHDEVAAFQRLFVTPDSETAHVERLFDLAKKDVAGFESYARRIAILFDGDNEALEDVVDGLFTIARADGAVHAAELAYLERVSEIFGISEDCFDRISARHVVPEEGDPYRILGVERSLTVTEIAAQYRVLAAENHPDRLLGRGVPPEAVALAHERMAAINQAWERIKRERG
ncbi:TerB family tellurite resistance protein [Bauldia sp.]|uniref:TerB family tellurite resistance protein n=1 Tax=Bauldia sp. TaxID=2575872 RepID=UPI003BAD07B4